MAQGTRGVIRGQVTDPNGAAVTGATVRLIDVARNQEIRTVQTNDSGEYQFLEVEPATYTVAIQAPGFSEARLTEVRLEPNRNLVLDASLSVGTTTEEVTVTASQELVDTTSPTLGTTVEQKRVVDLPLNGRQVLNLALLQPGVTTSNATGFGGGVGIRVNGNRGVENNITLDGGNNNEVAVGSTTGAQPRPDAVQEFRLLTSNFEAEFGRNTGAVINVVTRSGTNDFHGNARIFYRPTFLSAARFFDQNDPTDPVRRNVGDCPTNIAEQTRELCDKRRPFERKEIGGNFGGPIYLPRFGEGGPALFKGQNKAFFFVDYERRAQLIGASQTVSNLPTAAERAGDFSGLGFPLIDPQTGAPFPGNIIPENRISPIARFYNQFIPVTNATGTASVGADEITNSHFLTARTDFLINNAQSLNVTYNFFDDTVFQPFAFGGASVPGFGALNLRRTQNAVVRHTWSVTPNLVNSFLVNYARNNQPGVAPANAVSPSQIGFTGNFIANEGLAGPPFIVFNERGFNLGNSIQGPQTRVTENHQLQNSVSWATGRHNFKFGVDGTLYHQDQTFLFVNQGILTFCGSCGLNTTGDDFADFLIGNSPAAVQTGSNGLRDFRQSAYAAFAQDTWRLTDALTLSLGLRYEYTSPLTDLANRVTFYRPGATSQLLTSGQLIAPSGARVIIPEGGRAPNGLVYVGDPDPVLGGTVPEGGVAKDFNNFAPRVGFAYAPSFEGGFGRSLLGDRKTVIRGGFGVYYGAIVGDTALQQLTAIGFSGTDAFFFPGSGTLSDPFGPDPFPNFGGAGEDPDQGQLPNPFEATENFVSAPLNQFAQPIDPFIRTPYTYQYNLTVERGFATDYVISLSYVGNRGKKQYVREQVNPSLGTFFPFAANDPRASMIPRTNNANTRRANDDIRLGLVQLVSGANSWYDAFEANFQKRLGNDGLTFQAAYTFSKSITEADTQRGQLDLLDRRFGRALSSEDVPHRFVLSGLYDIPFTRNFTGLKKVLFGGFTIGGIYTAESGRPFTVQNPFDTTGTGGALLSFADLGEAYQQLDPRDEERAFNQNAFVAFGNPAVVGTDLRGRFRRGTAGANQFRANNGINNIDLILIKRTALSETTNLELRFEAFNALNHTQFGPDGTTAAGITGINLNLTSPNFGKYISARESRVVQLAARFSF
ncbi:MAG TPA: TonB-dependent receptor [Pyrinomonadaceae bacterium]|nr:TonB-dependent receptor [Pyrinomonadaceae bacterium]